MLSPLVIPPRSILCIPTGHCIKVGGGPRNRAHGSAYQGVFWSGFIWSGMNFDRSLWWLRATVMAYYSARKPPPWEALIWHCHQAASAPPPLICLWMHLSSPLWLKIKSYYSGCAGRAAHVTLAHSAEAKNIPTDVAVMQQAHVTSAFLKNPRRIWNALAGFHSHAVRISKGKYLSGL